MSEYTVTYPIHLGQEVWVDTMILPFLRQHRNDPQYLKGDVRCLMIHKRGKYSQKSMKIRIAYDWTMQGAGKQIYKYFKLPISAMGKTVFDEEPKEDD